MDILTLLIQLLSGAGGGHLAGNMMKSLNLGSFGNVLAGLVGGGVGSQVLNNILGAGSAGVASAAGGDIDIGNLITQVIGGGLGGGVMTMIVGTLRNMFQKH